MADLIYPATLPGPLQPWRQRRIERRTLRDLREPANANLARWTDRCVLAEATWNYTAAQMTTWLAWYEGQLSTQAARLRWFSAALPGAGGVITRVARYATPPQRSHRGKGVWQVSAGLYVRGAGVAPQQAATVAGDPGGAVLREDGTAVLREDGTEVLRG